MRVHVEVVEVVGRIVSGRLFRCANRVGVNAPVAHPVGVGLEVCHLRLTTREVTIDAGSASPVVGLVCDMSSIAEYDDSSDWKWSANASIAGNGATHSCCQGSNLDP